MASRRSFAGILAGIAAIVPARAFAQFTEQEVRNNADIVSTGNVTLNQTASGEQGVFINGVLVTEDGIYQTDVGQVVVNNGRVVATGDVSVSQTAAGSQQVTTVRTFPEADGEPARVCNPGEVIANPDTGQVFYQARDCCWYKACATVCPCDGSPGDGCGI
jgi:hypothetical protein